MIGKLFIFVKLIALTMKHFRHFLVLVAALGMIATSCQPAPFLTLNGPKSFNFPKDGGSQSFTFATNNDWSVSSSEPWCKVSPSSGSAVDGDVTITITVDSNLGYDSRSCTLTVKVKELTETISVSQEMNLGLNVSPTTLNLTNAAQDFEIEVQLNVAYLVTVGDDGKSFITYNGVKGLNSEKASFSIAANDTFDDRSGTIVFRQIGGDLVQTVSVMQSQTNGLFISTSEYDLSNEAHTLTVEVKANVEFDVVPDVDWVHCVQTKALVDNTVVLSVDKNDSSVDREGVVRFNQKNGANLASLTINQAYRVPDGSVDLGMVLTREDGTTYRLFWAECNLGALTPEGFGDYYAWGEVETHYISLDPLVWKEGYASGYSSYKWYSEWGVIKYCPENCSSAWFGDGEPDNILILEPEDDAAHVALGGKWRMPTKEELTALIEQCEWKLESKNGVEGYSVISKMEGNDNSIFLPFAGGRIGNASFEDFGWTGSGNYWSSSLTTTRTPGMMFYPPYLADNLSISSKDVLIYNGTRETGYSIRPVTE